MFTSSHVFSSDLFQNRLALIDMSFQKHTERTCNKICLLLDHLGHRLFMAANFR